MRLTERLKIDRICSSTSKVKHPPHSTYLLRYKYLSPLSYTPPVIPGDLTLPTHSHRSAIIPTHIIPSPQSSLPSTPRGSPARLRPPNVFLNQNRPRRKGRLDRDGDLSPDLVHGLTSAFSPATAHTTLLDQRHVPRARHLALAPIARFQARLIIETRRGLALPFLAAVPPPHSLRQAPPLRLHRFPRQARLLLNPSHSLRPTSPAYPGRARSY